MTERFLSQWMHGPLLVTDLLFDFVQTHGLNMVSMGIARWYFVSASWAGAGAGCGGNPLALAIPALEDHPLFLGRLL